MVRVGVRTSRCSRRRPDSDLRVRPVGRSRCTISSTSLMCKSHPILGSRSSPDRAISNQVGIQCYVFRGFVAEAQACHIAFSCESLVAMDGNDVAG